MSTKLELLDLLSRIPDQFVSGQEIADTLGVSRNAVWKAVKSLQAQGYPIESFAGTGYRLKQKADILSADILKEKIKYPCKLHVFDKIDSTNNFAKTLTDVSVPQLIVAQQQTAGRGRLGRSFYSPEGKGIYMTLAFSPDFGLDQAMLITAMSAVAVCRAIEKVTGLNPKIKWVNDIYLNDKKICGILTEAETNFETGQIQKIIVGIGMNCFEDDNMPEDVKDRATYMENPPKTFERADLIVAVTDEFFGLLENFNRVQMIREYKTRSFILGEQILIFNPAVARSIGRLDDKLSEGIRAKAIDIDENGGLVVEFLEGLRSGQMETLSTGEISIRKA